MKPGFAFGGSCLPKDVRALHYRAKEVDLEMPVIQSILPATGCRSSMPPAGSSRAARRRVGLLGFSSRPEPTTCAKARWSTSRRRSSAKATSADLRREVSLARIGANKEYISTQIPHLSSLLCEAIDEVIDRSDVIVVGNAAPEFAEALKKTRRTAHRRSGQGQDRPGGDPGAIRGNLLVKGHSSTEESLHLPPDRSRLFSSW